MLCEGYGATDAELSPTKTPDTVISSFVTSGFVTGGRRAHRRWTATVCMVAGLVCGTAATQEKTLREATASLATDCTAPLLVGSKTFTESRLLAEMMAQLIEENTDIAVQRRHGLGGTAIAFGALQQGELDLYPEYTGTIWYNILNRAAPPAGPLQAYAVSQSEVSARWNLRLLSPFGFNNSYALAVPEQLAKELHLASISDLVPHAASLDLALSHEFIERRDGWNALAKRYGLEAGNARGIEHALAYQALAAGSSDVTDAYTTDGKLMDYPVRLLQDNLRFFPPYQAAPLLSARAIACWPELPALLDRMSFSLNDETMRLLNHRTEQAGDTAAVARQFLRSLSAEGAGADRVSTDRAGKDRAADSLTGLFAQLFAQLPPQLLPQILQHLWLSGLGLGIALLLAVPTGIAMSRLPQLAPPILQFVSSLQTIPALALFAFLIALPGFGLGVRSAVAAIALYAVLPILHNTWTGIREISPPLIDTARAMGLTDGELLRRIQLPLAISTIMAGVRTASVMCVGLATLAAFVGAGGLGDSILTGLQLLNTSLILAGALPAAALALLTDLLLWRLEQALRPKGL